MMRTIFNFMFGKPGRVTRIGECVGYIGYFFSMAGFFGKMPGMVIAAFNNGSIDFRPISELYPSLPLWWVPESGATIILALLMCVAGLYIRSFGHMVDALYSVK